MLGLDAELQAEAAADVRRHDAQLLLRYRQHASEFGTHVVRGLRTGPDRVSLHARIVFSDGVAGFHGIDGDPGHVHVDGHHMGCSSDGAVDGGLVADGMDEADIVGRLVPDSRCAGFQQVARRRDGGSLLVLHLNPVSRVLRLGKGLGEHCSHGETDVPHAVGREQRMPGLEMPRAVQPLAVEEGAKGTNIREVGPREHGRDTGGRHSLLRADRQDLCIGTG